VTEPRERAHVGAGEAVSSPARGLVGAARQAEARVMFRFIRNVVLLRWVWRLLRRRA
jgi:hypothetical protein